jgi:hypothetical protein
MNYDNLNKIKSRESLRCRYRQIRPLPTPAKWIVAGIGKMDRCRSEHTLINTK